MKKYTNEHEFYDKLPSHTKRRLFDDEAIDTGIDKPFKKGSSIFDMAKIFHKFSDKNIAEFVIKARGEGIDLMTLGRQIGISPKDATLKDYTLMYNVAKDIMKRYGFKEVEIYQSHFFKVEMKSRLSEIEDYEKKKNNFSEKERLELSNEEVRSEALGKIAYETGKRMLFEARKLIETVERGDISVDQLGNVGTILEEARQLMYGIPNEEMKSWDNERIQQEFNKLINLEKDTDIKK